MTNAQRVDISKQRPAAYKPLLVELVRLRTAQINGCALCLRRHTRVTRLQDRHVSDEDRVAG